MLSTETMIKEMSIQELWYPQLRDKLTPYGFGHVEVKDFIKHGTPDKYENHVRNALGMITPKWWKPRPVRLVKAFKKTMPKDTVRLDPVKGIEHANYKGVTKRKYKLSVEEQQNADTIYNVIKGLGGLNEVSRIIGCNRNTVWEWSKPRKHGVYIPKKYLAKVREYAFQNNIDIPYLDLLAMIPTPVKRSGS